MSKHLGIQSKNKPEGFEKIGERCETLMLMRRDHVVGCDRENQWKVEVDSGGWDDSGKSG